MIIFAKIDTLITMEKPNRTIITVIVCVAVAAAVFAAGGMAVSQIAENKLREALADIPGGSIGFRDVRVELFAGNLDVLDVEVSLRDSAKINPDIDARIKAVKLEQLNWKNLFHGEACAKRLIIREPAVNLVLTGETPPAKDSTETSPEESFIKKVSISEVRIEDGEIGLSTLNDSMKAAAQNIDFSVRDIGISLADGGVEFNDSSYRLSLDSLDYTDAPGISRIQIGRLSTAESGPVEALGMHLYCNVSKEKVAEKMGKVSAMWYDVRLDTLRTGALNIPGLVRDRRIDIGSVILRGSDIVLFQDDRYPPPAPYPTIQEDLNNIPLPLKIQQIDARFKTLTFIWETTHVNRGTLPMKNVRLALSSVSNAPGNQMGLGIKAGFKGNSRLNLTLSVRNDKRETTRGKMQISNFDASQLDAFLRPLFGATAKADIHQMDCSFKGDKRQLASEFCMLYDNLALTAWNDATAPYQVVARNSGAITLFAKIALPKSNPIARGNEPKRVEYSITRDPMQPYPSYFILNMVQGMLKTVLPGGTKLRSQMED